MSSIFSQLSARERLIVIGGALVAGCLLGYVLVLEPFQAALAEYQREIPAKQEDLAYMQQAAMEVRSLQGTPSKTNPLPTDRSPLAAIDHSAKEAGLAKALKRVEPEGQQKVRIWLEKAAFDDTLRWFALLGSSYGIEVAELVAERGAEEGLIKARVTLVKEL